MAYPTPQTRPIVTLELAIEVWESLGLLPMPGEFISKASELRDLLRGYKPEIQRAQTIPQRIYRASYLVCKAMELEYDLLWGRYGYHAMVRRLMLKLPFRGVQEATQYLILPLRYCVVMELKSQAAHMLNAVGRTYYSFRSSVEGLARGANIRLQPEEIPPGHNAPPQINLGQDARRLPALSSQNQQRQGPVDVLESARQELTRTFQAREARGRQRSSLFPVPRDDNPSASEARRTLSVAEFDRRILRAFGYADNQYEQPHNNVPRDMLQHVIQNIVDRIRAMRQIDVEDSAAAEAMGNQSPSSHSPLISSASPTPSRSSTSSPVIVGGEQSPRYGSLVELSQLRRYSRARSWSRSSSRLNSPRQRSPAGQPSRQNLRWSRNPAPYPPRRRSRSTGSGYSSSEP